ncbi:TPA: hypothetical protein ACIPE5_002102 [Salmonella enterica subsp. diarizonae serovar 61:r:-]
MKANTDGLTMNQLAERNAEHVATIAALESRCAALSAKLSMINDLMEAAEQANKLAQEATEKLVQERNALAAENAAMKNAITAVSKTSEECEINGDELKYVVEPSEFDALTDLLDETPATDAFLAEVLAQGVEMFSEKFGGGTLLSDMVKEVAADFAAKLRKGGAV